MPFVPLRPFNPCLAFRALETFQSTPFALHRPRDSVEPLTQVAWDASGSLLAIAEGYDWAYGQREKTPAPKVWIATTGADVLDKQPL